MITQPLKQPMCFYTVAHVKVTLHVVIIQGRVRFDEDGTAFQDRIKLLQYRKYLDGEELNSCSLQNVVILWPQRSYVICVKTLIVVKSICTT